VAINRVTNSNAQLVKNNIDVLTFGGAAEFAVGHMFDETTTHYFRARVAAAGTTSLALTNLPNGTHSYRLRGIHAGQIGKYVTNTGNAVSVVVDLAYAALDPRLRSEAA